MEGGELVLKGGEFVRFIPIKTADPAGVDLSLLFAVVEDSAGESRIAAGTHCCFYFAMMKTAECEIKFVCVGDDG